MGDLNTPPPSYEIATGTTPSRNQFFRNTPSSGRPPPNNETVSSSIQQFQQPSSRLSSPSSANRREHQQRLENDTKTMFCVCVVLISLGFFIFFIIEIARVMSSGTDRTDNNY